MFHPVVETWFERRFGAPTPAQLQAWPLIAGGRDVLVTAPTGSALLLLGLFVGLGAVGFLDGRLALQRLVGDGYGLAVHR